MGGYVPSKRQRGMGFRDLKVFNATLLAKQSWRLATASNPLLFAIFKVCYFKNSSVIDAPRGYAPSFTWRSIWGAKSLLLEGLGWQIGNGTLVDALKDSWVPFNNKLITPLALSPLMVFGFLILLISIMVVGILLLCLNCSVRKWLMRF